MANDIVTNYSDKDLFYYLQWLRLQKAKQLNDANIERNRKDEVKKESGWENFKRGLSNIGKSVSNTVQRTSSKDQTITNALNSFNQKHSNVSEANARSAMVNMFKDDKYGISRLTFAVEVVLDSEYDYEFEKEGLEAASMFLFGNLNHLETIKRDLEHNFKAIHGNSLSDKQKALLIGIGAAALITTFAVPILSVGGLKASAAATTAALAAKGFGDMQLAVGLIATNSLLTFAAITGGTYLLMKQHNKLEAMAEFKKLSAEEQNMALAIQGLIINQLKKECPKDIFKEELDKILQSMNNMKGDMDYFTFVEGENTTENQKRLNGFHNFDNLLMEII